MLLDPGPPNRPNRTEKNPVLVSHDKPAPKPMSRGCEAHEVTDSCILTPNLSMQQKSNIATALRHGNVRLCDGERLVLSGIPARPRVRVAPPSMRREPAVLLYGLRALAGEYPQEVEIRCRR